MAILKRTILAFFIASVACFSCSAASAEAAVKELKLPAASCRESRFSRCKHNLIRSLTPQQAAGLPVTPEFRIGLIGADPGQLLHGFDPFVRYLRSRLRSSGIRHVTVFAAKDLNRMRGRIQKGKLDFILTSAFPILEMECREPVPAVVAPRGTAREDFAGTTECKQPVPAVVALQGATREEAAVFFVRKRSSMHELGDLQGKTIVFGTPSSTAAYAMAIAELKKNRLSIIESTDEDAPEDAVRYAFAGEPINQAFRVIRYRADAGVLSSSDWEALPPKEQSRLRIIHRTAPITRLLGSFHPDFPHVLREVVEKTLVDMSGNRKGRTALAEALNMTKFELLTEEDRTSLQRLKLQLLAPECEP